MDPRFLDLPEDHPRRRMMEEREARRNSPEGVQQEVTLQVQGTLDAFARTGGYDNIISAASYAASTVPKFAAEAARAILMRDMLWAACYVIMEDVKAGTRTLPSVEGIMAELPVPTWE